jgi:hypothetical protein
MDLFRQPCLRAMALATTLLIAACGGGSEPREQAADPQSAEFTGQVLGIDSDTPQTGATVKAKGATGLLRTTAPSAGDTYAVSASGLTGPYLLVSGLMGTVTTRTGLVNLNELARLQSALLLGEFPAAALATFGNGSPSLALITEENLSAARAKVVALLQKDFGITVPAGLADFINAPFTAKPGDPVYDTLLALNAKIAEVGTDVYATRIEAVVAEARRCNVQKVLLAVGGETVEFCPATLSTTADVNDATVTVFAFASQAGARLTLRARGRTLLDARYAPATGAAYTCTGNTCRGFAIGEAAANGTRPITFTAATLSRRGTPAVFNGMLVAPAPGVALPTLPCTDNRFFVVLPDRTVVADCVSNTVGDLGLTGTFGTQQGQTQHAVYPFANRDGANGVPASDPPTIVHLVLDGSNVVNITVTRTDPATGALTLDYKCRAAACNGVTIGAPVINSDAGFNAALRRVTFDGTDLSAVGSDGVLGGTPGARLFGTLTAVFIDRADLGLTPPTTEGNCAGLTETVTYAPSNETEVYAICPELAGAVAPSANATTRADGGLRISFPASAAPQPGDPPPQFDVLLLDTDAAGAVTRVVLDPTSSLGSSFGASFACTGDCSNVVVSAPDGAGLRTVTFTDTLLNLVEPDGFATDARRARVTGRFTVPAPDSVATTGASTRSTALQHRLPGRAPLRR